MFLLVNTCILRTDSLLIMHGQLESSLLERVSRPVAFSILLEVNSTVHLRDNRGLSRFSRSLDTTS